MYQVGHKIKKIRELKNLTQEHVAEELGISQSGYCKTEHIDDKIDLNKLKKISVIFNMKVDDIINFDEKSFFKISINDHAHSLNGTNNSDTTEVEFYREELRRKDILIDQLLKKLFPKRRRK